jgi:hypothetical protein
MRHESPELRNLGHLGQSEREIEREIEREGGGEKIDILGDSDFGDSRVSRKVFLRKPFLEFEIKKNKKIIIKQEINNHLSHQERKFLSRGIH